MMLVWQLDCFILLSIEGGTPSTALGPKMGMEATSLTRTEIYGR
jgi:hypothetical protein